MKSSKELEVKNYMPLKPIPFTPLPNHPIIDRPLPSKNPFDLGDEDED